MMAKNDEPGAAMRLLGALHARDGHGGTWPGLWYRYLDWRLGSFPEVGPLGPADRRAALFECRRRLSSNRAVATARVIRLGSVVLGVVLGLVVGALVAPSGGVLLALGAALMTMLATGFAAVPVVRRLALPAFRQCLREVVAERQASAERGAG